MNEDRCQLGSTLPQNTRGNAIRATGLPDVHRFQDPMHRIMSNYRQGHGTPERRRSRRRDARIEQGGIRGEKEAEEISLFRGSICNRSIRANKRRKGRFTEVIRDIFDKRPEIFISRRAMEVSALPIYESTLRPSKNIPATIPSGMKISKSDRRRRVFPCTISIVSLPKDKRTVAIEPWILWRKRFSCRWNESAHPIKDHCPYLFSRDRSIPRDKARFTPTIGSKEASHCPPISPIKVPESTFRAWWSCWRESIIIKSYKIMVRVTNRRENGVFITRRSSGEA